MTGKQKLEWVEREIPQPGPGELQIKLNTWVSAEQIYIFTRKEYSRNHKDEVIKSVIKM